MWSVRCQSEEEGEGSRGTLAATGQLTHGSCHGNHCCHGDDGDNSEF